MDTRWIEHPQARRGGLFFTFVGTTVSPAIFPSAFPRPMPKIRPILPKTSISNRPDRGKSSFFVEKSAKIRSERVVTR